MPLVEMFPTETEFAARFPGYEYTTAIDELRARDFSRLDAQGHVYLDYTGAGLYGLSQVREHAALLEQGVFGNPHSHNPTSSATTQMVERVRDKVLEYFNASPDDYAAVFTANASTALKLVGESYPFKAGGRYLLTFDNHNSVNGIREFARAKGAAFDYAPLRLPEMRCDGEALEILLGQADRRANNLFAYPAQSNFSGVQHPLEWVGKARAMGWDVLLDAAAFAPTNPLDLSRVRPDFVPISFYKMFGYPTGVGCLLARREALAKLRRPWFSGGSVTVVSIQGDKHYPAEGAAAFEDGTLDYLNIPAVEIGLRRLETIGVETIHARCRRLIAFLLDRLTALRHSNGRPLVRVYGPTTDKGRGGAATLNFYDPEDRVVDHLLIEREAGRENISLRTGCFCNPGGGEVALRLSKTELIGCFQRSDEAGHKGFTPEDFKLCIDGKSTGAVRVSLGMVSNFEDVRRFLEFAERFIDRRAEVG